MPKLKDIIPEETMKKLIKIRDQLRDKENAVPKKEEKE